MTEDKQSQEQSLSDKKSETLGKLKSLAEQLDNSVKKLESTFGPAEQLISAFFKATTDHLRSIITIGYASFFAIWALTSTHMEPFSSLLTAVFMIISVGAYISNEICNLYIYSKLSEGINEFATKVSTKENASIVELSEHISEFRPHLNKAIKNLEVLNRIRPISLSITMIFAFLAVLVMLSSLLIELWEKCPDCQAIYHNLIN